MEHGTTSTLRACVILSLSAAVALGLLQVAERSLFLWNNEYIVQLVAQHRETVRGRGGQWG